MPDSPIGERSLTLVTAAAKQPPVRTTRPESSPVCPAPGQRHLLLFGCIALAVLGLKCRLLLDVGMDDMAQYEAWGRLVTERGLVSAYCGIYFPLQWQLFGATWVLAQDTGTPFFVLSKLTNLLFDLGKDRKSVV